MHQTPNNNDNTKIDNTKMQSFTFNQENIEKSKEIIQLYPKGKERSAIMPLLYLAQKQNNNWIPKSAMDHIAEILDIPKMQVYEVASFYTMYNKKKVGKYLVQICRTTPCWLCGSDEITKSFKKILAIDINQTTADGLFTLTEVECLGACVNAPVVQINDNYHENLDESKIETIIEQIKNKNQKNNTIQ